MTWIFCIDEQGGMMFFGRRQSQDRLLRAWLLERIGGDPLWMSTYSAKLFADAPTVIADDAYMEKAARGDHILVEDGPYDLCLADEVLLCHWNRHYPADRYLDMATLHADFERVALEELAGSSHEKITVETYRRKKT